MLRQFSLRRSDLLRADVWRDQAPIDLTSPPLLQVSAASTVQQSTQSLDALTGLRFIAAYCVVIHHIISNTGALAPTTLPLGDGAVSFFFVLSGFILTHVYFHRLENWRDVKRFWFTRWARIWPLHVVCLLLAALILYGPHALWANRFVLGPKGLVNGALLQSWIPNYAWAFSFNGVSWSISDEMCFYFAFPIFMCASVRRFKLTFVIAMTYILLAVWTIRGLGQQHHLPESFDTIAFVHLNPAIRIMEFMIGVAVGRMYVSRARSKPKSTVLWSTCSEFLAVGLFVLAWLYPLSHGALNAVLQSPYAGPTIAHWLRFVGYSPVFAFVIWVFARSRGVLAWIASTPLMVYLGEISFSLYMIHTIVISVIKQYFPYVVQSSPAMLVVAASVFSIAASMALFHIVEMPAKNGLLKLYDRKWHAAWQSTRGLWWEFIRSPKVTYILLPTALCISLLCQFNRWGKQFVDQQPAPRYVARFGDEADLLAYQCRVVEGNAELLFVWQTGPNPRRHLFIHICDGDGKRLRHARLNNDSRFSPGATGMVWVQRISIPAP